MNKNSNRMIAAAALVLLGGVVVWQLVKDRDGSMAGMDHSQMTMASNSESTKAYEVAMADMMKGMMVPMTGKPDLDFVVGMLPHHQGAIDMAKIVLKFGKDAEVKTLAEGVIKAQEGEIAFMQDWLAKADQQALPTMPESIKAGEQAMALMMQNMMMPYTDDADVDFIKGMIPHHQGAIDMAKNALQFAKDPALLKLANEIIAAQDGEIAFMNGWLKRNAQ